MIFKLLSEYHLRKNEMAYYDNRFNIKPQRSFSRKNLKKIIKLIIVEISYTRKNFPEVCN